MRRPVALLPAACVVCAPLLAQQPLETVEVIATTPLGAAADTDTIASNIQSATAEELRERGALDLTEFMQRSFANVFVSEAQSNPLQPDLRYRGFVGSPLLGLPQGIAVYQDALRVNEPFGDTVNWALIPQTAIETVHLMPGSNPLFGLNALGGAIAIRTKDGFTTQGSAAEIFGGSFARLGAEAETGGQLGDAFSYYLTGTYLQEDGWRDFSPTQAAQLFSKLAWRSEQTRVDASLSLADTDLIGNGPAPIKLLELDRKQVFTRPDRTQNELLQLNLELDHAISESLSVTGNVYVRASDVRTYNGDDSDFEECEDTPGFICEDEDDAETIVLDPAGTPVPADERAEGATVNRTNLRQHGVGVGLQLGWDTRAGGRENRFVAGLSHDASDVRFASSTELGRLDATRQAIPSGLFVAAARTGLHTRTTSTGLYFSDTLSVSDAVAVTLSGRYNHTQTDLEDQLGTALNGAHAFDRFNPALGVTYRLAANRTLFASYSESNRVPSPVELTCADEDDPCRLPNAFLADPPLEQVVASTLEAGVRGKWNGGDWSAGAFHTINDDDILFISAGALTNEGYFDNVGKTRRAGLELSISAQPGERLTWFAHYTYMDATFDQHLVVPSPNNPAAVHGEIAVRPGDRLPLIPAHLFKAGGRITVTDNVRVGGDLLASAGQYLRGDESNLAGTTSAYAVLNAQLEYRLGDAAVIFLTVNNVLDTEYETFGLFGEADEVLGEDFEDSRFLSPGAPRAAWLGLRLIF